MNARLTGVVLLTAGSLAAQQPAKLDSIPHPMMGHGPMAPMMNDPIMQHMGPAVMRMMLYAPQHLLVRKDALGLSPDQVNRLVMLVDGSKGTRDAAFADADTHLKELEQAMNAAKPDTLVVKTHFTATHNAMGKAHWAMLAASVQARAVLTDAQRAQLQVWADSMQAWAQQHRKMMNPSRPD
jgi:Spy/CpxP family protein refolding chaperone